MHIESTNRIAGLDGLSSDDAARRELEELSREFEAVLLAEVLKSLSETMGSRPDSESASNRLDGVIWQELARQIAIQRPLGLAEAAYRQLEQDSRTSASAENETAAIRTTREPDTGALLQAPGFASSPTSAAAAAQAITHAVAGAPSAPTSTSAQAIPSPNPIPAPPVRREEEHDGGHPAIDSSARLEAGDARAPARDVESSAEARLQRPVEGPITSAFGYRSDPFVQTRRLHRGQDIAAVEGTAVRASGAGDVVFAGPRSGYGNTVVLRHENGVETLYAHLSRVAVSVGARVESGETVGRVGQTGRATGPHLHFEVRRDGNAEDPEGWL